MKDFYRRIPLRSLTSTLNLPEANYPICVDLGIAIFHEPADAVLEQRGELQVPIGGLNFLRVADVRCPIPIPRTRIEDSFSRGYCPAKTPEDAIANWKQIILERRSNFGLTIARRELDKIHQAIALHYKTLKRRKK